MSDSSLKSPPNLSNYEVACFVSSLHKKVMARLDAIADKLDKIREAVAFQDTRLESIEDELGLIVDATLIDGAAPDSKEMG